MLKKIGLLCLAVSFILSATPAKANDAAAYLLGGLFAGVIINQSMQPRVYVQPTPSYVYPPPSYYVPPPPVYYKPRVCQYESWYDNWGYLHTQRVCY